MAEENVRYNLQFNADTAQAKSQIQQLQDSLTKLLDVSSKGDSQMPLTKSILEAQNQATQLKISLQEATNVKTGNLDLSKFSQSLKNSGMTLEQYRKSLTSLGPEGQKAFVNLATAISKAEVPLKRTSTLMQDLGVTLKNTIKWQLSSSAVHGFMGAIQSAWGYAQDLNQSLNNIRIVTGQNVEQMAAFADKANAAAKALSTTTTSYTDASLIYYQQGLNDQEVEERTNTTIKLANVSRESVEETSNQLTAIWNNFADGTQSLEYYADVITALGAATASSSQEIATGIEKFASVGETVGLSYEYATAALATVTATTRASADTVGTAFKTLFARIQDLELGKTLDDGTTLGSYSQALEKVGINIKDVNGEVKTMDTLLDEMGGKWNTLSKDSQIALAQNVAGVRQYTQLMALMENWDFMQENVQIARESSGTLQDQADIYAESWEAASKRVQASLESVYQELINDEFVIDVTNGFAEVIDGVSLFIETLGGAKGVFLSLGTTLLNVYGQQLGQSIDNTIYKMKMLTKEGRADAESLKYQAVEQLQDMAKEQGNTLYGKAIADSYNAQAAIQKVIIQNSEKYSDIEKQAASQIQQQVQAYGNLYAQKAQALDTAQQELEVQEAIVEATIAANAEQTNKQNQEKASAAAAELATLQTSPLGAFIQWQEDAATKGDNEALQMLQDLAKECGITAEQIDKVKQRQQELKEVLETSKIPVSNKDLTAQYTEQANSLKKAAQEAETLVQITDKLQYFEIPESMETPMDEGAKTALREYLESTLELGNVSDEAKEKIQQMLKVLSGQDTKTNLFDLVTDLEAIKNGLAQENLQGAIQSFKEFGRQAGLTDAQIDKLTQDILAYAKANTQAADANANFVSKTEQAKSNLESFGKTFNTVGQKIVLFGQTLSSVVMTINNIKSLIETMKDPDASGFEKFTSVAMNLGMTLTNLGPLLSKAGPAIVNIGTAALSSGGGVASFAASVGSASPLLAGLVSIVAAVGPWLLLAGAIGGVVYALYRLSTAEERAHEQLEQNIEDLEKLSEVYDEAKNNYDNLMSSINNYESAKSSLDELTTGTEEWNTQLMEVNSQVLALLETYPELAQYVRNVNGELTFDEQGFKDFTNDATQRYQEAQGLKTSSLIQANAAKQEEMIDRFRMDSQFQANEDAIRKQAEAQAREYMKTRGYTITESVDKESGIISYKASNDNGTSNLEENGLYNASVKEYSRVLGNSFADVSNEQLKILAKAISNNDLAYDDTKNGNPAQFSAAAIADLLSLDTEDDAVLISALQANTDALINMANEYNEQDLGSDALEVSAIQDQLKQENANNFSEQSTVMQQGIAEAIQQGFEGNKENLVEAAKAEVQEGKTEAEIAEDYLISQGLGDLFSEVSVEDGQVIAKDAEGKVIESLTQSYDAILNTLAEQKARTDYTSENAEEVTKNLLADVSEYMAAGLNKELAEKVATGNLKANELTESDIRELESIVTKDLPDGIQRIIESARKERDDALTASNIGAVNDALQDLSNISNMSADEIRNASSQLEVLFKQGGQQALDAAVELSNKTGLQLSSLFGEEGLFKDVDFTNTSLSELTDILDQAGYAGDSFTGILKILIDVLSNLSPLDKAINKYNELSSAIGLEVGETIDKNTYNALSEEAQSYFSLTANGLYKLIGDAEQFYNIVNKESVQGFSDAINDTYGQLESLYDTATIDTAYGTKVSQNKLNNLGENLYGLETNNGAIERQVNANIQNQGQTVDTGLVYDTQQLQAMVLLLNEIDSAQAQVFQNAIDNGSVTADIVKQVEEAYNNQTFSVDDVRNAINNLTNEMGSEQEAILSTAASLQELDTISNNLVEQTGIAVEGTDAYNSSLIGIATQYENTKQEIENFQQALQTNDSATIKAAEDALILATRAAELGEKYDLSAEDIEDYAKALKSSGQYSKVCSKELAELAKDQLRYDQAIESCNSNMEDWQKTLNKLSKDKMLDQSTVKTLSKAYGDMFDVDGSALSDAFLRNTDNLKLLEEAANGSEDAYNALRSAIQQDIEGQLSLDDTDFFDKKAEVEAAMAEMDFENIEVGAELNDEGFLNALTEMVNAAGMTADQATDYLSSMGVDAEVKEVDDTATETQEHQNIIAKIERQGEMNVPGAGATGDTIPIDSVTYEVQNIPQQSTKENKAFALEVTSAHKSSGGGVKHSTSSKTGGGGSGSGGGGGGGGGSSKPAKKVQKTKFTDIGERYHTITNQIDDQVRATEKLVKLEDRLYGAAKLKAMKQQSAELAKQIELNQQKLKEAQDYLKVDKADLEAQVANWNATYGANLTVQYDADGNILNYDEIVNAILDTTNQWEDYLNSLSTQEEQDSDENQQYQEDLDNNTSAIMDAIAQYEETDALIEELEDTMEDLIDEITQVNFDRWAETLELVIDKFDRQAELLEHTNKLLGISGDNIYTAAQALTQQTGELNADGSFSGGQYGEVLDTLGKIVGAQGMEGMLAGSANVLGIAQADATSGIGNLYQQYQNYLNGDYENGINQDQYVEGLKSLQEELYALGDTIVEIDEYVFTAYRNALEDGKERLERYTKIIDNAADSLDHMNNLLDLIGQQYRYDKKNVILSGAKDVAQSNLEAKTSIYEMAKAQWEDVKSAWDSMTDEQREHYKDTYDTALDYYTEASSDWYDAQEEFAEAAKALAENQLAEAAQAAQAALLGEGVSWDAISDQLDRYSSIGEEYLTKTNQIYEVTKLVRTVQADIDKTSNTAAKKRLETFKKQTEELARQEELTEYEMELQNRKYELLLAEIALQEAQNAKSQVRLTRDSEGNYSYTYTTDEEELQQAEDDFLQKQNELYNFLLEGTTDYYTKYVQTMQEATETFAAINEAYLNGEITTEEEYHRQMLEAQQYYNNLMQTYKNLYNIAMDELGDQAVDSWTTDAGLIVDTTQQLNEDVGNEADGLIEHGQRLSDSYAEFTNQYITYVEDAEGRLHEFTEATDSEHANQQSYWNKTRDVIRDYYNEIDDNIPMATQTIEDMTGAVVELGKDAAAQAANIDKLTDSIANQLKKVNEVVAAWAQYAEAVDAVRESLAALQTDINASIDAEAGDVGWIPSGDEGTDLEGDGSGGGGGSGDSGGGTGAYGDYVKVRGNSPNRYFTTESGESYHLVGTAANGYSGSDPEAIEIQKAWDSYVGSHGYSNSIDWSTNKLDLNVIGLDTGGYTGEWSGEEGKLALLHEKELVLNADDTANMLKSIELVREIIKVIDLNALSTAANSISALNASMAPAQEEKQVLEQEVHIEANFPNATDKEEILEAFNSLSDLASQYANRKR